VARKPNAWSDLLDACCREGPRLSANKSRLRRLASIVICTRNRAAYLERTIREAAAQTLSSGEFEIVVVDNGSTDSTPEIFRKCQSAITMIPLRYVVEGEVGLSAARNRAIGEAGGEIVCFLDDDAVPEPGWLEWLIRGYGCESSVMCVGGAITPVYEGGVPAWFPPKLEFTFKPELRGAGLHRVTYPLYPYGANFSIRAEAVRRVGGFNTSLGYKGRELIPSEETEFLLRIEKAGYDILMESRALVRHIIPASRLTPAYLRLHAYSGGRGRALLENLHEIDSEEGEALICRLRELAAVGGRRLRLRYRYWPERVLHSRTNQRQAVQRQCELAAALGYCDQQWKIGWRRLWVRGGCRGENRGPS